MTEEKRIYVIIAETVQTETVRPAAQFGPVRTLLCPTVATKTVVQPKGRIAAQCAHVVSQMRMFQKDIIGTSAYTTIILSVPDSYNLQFRSFLLEQRDVRIYKFFDTNDEYGSGGICTAICTEPIFKADAGYALDYLNLWS